MEELKTIQLSLTEEEVELIEKSICAKIIDLKEDIEMADRCPGSDYLAANAAEAKANIPVIEELLFKITKIRFDQKYPLLKGENV